MGILFLQVLPLNVDVSDLFTLTFKEEKSNQIDFVTMFALEIEALLWEIGTKSVMVFGKWVITELTS